MLISNILRATASAKFAVRVWLAVVHASIPHHDYLRPIVLGIIRMTQPPNL
jgi:hypothetical protein